MHAFVLVLGLGFVYILECIALIMCPAVSALNTSVNLHLPFTSSTCAVLCAHTPFSPLCGLCIVTVQRALKEYVMSIDAAFAKQFEEFHVGFEGSFGAKHVSPRTLKSDLIGSLVCVEGIVTKCELTDMRPWPLH